MLTTKHPGKGFSSRETYTSPLGDICGVTEELNFKFPLSADKDSLTGDYSLSS
jgi:hypothetical protein